MAIYRYRGINTKGEIVTGYICGTDSSEARKTIAGYAIDLVSLYRQWGVHVKKKNAELFFTYLGYYLKAGYRLSPALSLVRESFSGSLKNIISSIHARLAEGVLLSEACKDYPMVFSSPVIALMSAGERSGQFVHACHQCAVHISQIHQKKEKFLKAVSYPLLSFFFFLCSFFILVQTLLPNVLALCDDLGYPSSWATHLLQALNQVFSWKFGVLACLIGVITLVYRKWIFFKVAGRVITIHIYTQFFSILALLMKENIPLIEALEIAYDGVHFTSLKPFFESVIQEIKKGKSLSQSVKFIPYFPKSYTHLLQSGDNSGHQTQAIIAMSQLMTQSIDRFYERLTFWISPILMIFIAFCFWVLIEGTFIPLYNSMNGFSYDR